MDQTEDFIRLYASHERRLRRYVSPLMPQADAVDDVVQETAVALMRKFDEYDSAQPFFHWACRFAYFEVLQYRRRVARHGFAQLGDEALEAIAEASKQRGSTEASEASRQAALERCLSGLAAEDRRLLALRYGSEETVADLAARMGRPAKSLYRSLAKIRERLADCVSKRLAMEGGT